MGKIYARMNCICIAMSNIIKWWRNFGNNGDYTEEKYERSEPSIEEIREAIKVSREKAEAM